MSILSTTLYILNKESKKTALNIPKLNTIFLVYIHDFEEQNFFNKLFASDLLIL